MSSLPLRMYHSITGCLPLKCFMLLWYFSCTNIYELIVMLLLNYNYQIWSPSCCLFCSQVVYIQKKIWLKSKFIGFLTISVVQCFTWEISTTFYYFVLPASNTPMLIGLNIFFCIVHSPLLGDWTNCTVTLRTITVFEYLKIVGLKLFYKYLSIFIKHR